MDFEEKVIELVKEYGAPENIEEDIIEFLINSGNVYSIIEIYKETAIQLIRKLI